VLHSNLWMAPVFLQTAEQRPENAPHKPTQRKQTGQHDVTGYGLFSSGATVLAHQAAFRFLGARIIHCGMNTDGNWPVFVILLMILDEVKFRLLRGTCRGIGGL